VFLELLSSKIIKYCFANSLISLLSRFTNDALSDILLITLALKDGVISDRERELIMRTTKWVNRCSDNKIETKY
jgi:hypothetical protein